MPVPMMMRLVVAAFVAGGAIGAAAAVSIRSSALQAASAGRPADDLGALKASFRRPPSVPFPPENPFSESKGRFWSSGCLMGMILLVLMVVIGATAGSANVGWLFPGAVLGFALLLPAIVVQSRASSFEVRRWADSDHPMTTSSDDDDDE